MAETPRYSNSTCQMALCMDSEGDAVRVRLSSLHIPDGMPVWTRRNSAERDALIAELEQHFGKTHVAVKRSDDSTDREITLRRSEGTTAQAHRTAVENALEDFVERHRFVPATGDETHQRDLALHVSGMKLRDGIHRIVQDQLLDPEQKTDAILEFLKLRRDTRRGGDDTRGR